MIPDSVKAPQCDFTIVNDGTLAQLRDRAEAVWLCIRKP
jgi:hypothetical protein